MARYGQQSQTWTQSILQALAARQTACGCLVKRTAICLRSHIPPHNAFLRKDSSSNLAEDLKILKKGRAKMCPSRADSVQNLRRCWHITHHRMSGLTITESLQTCCILTCHPSKLDVLTTGTWARGKALSAFWSFSSFAGQLLTTYLFTLLESGQNSSKRYWIASKLSIESMAGI